VSSFLPVVAAGFIAAAVVGYFSIRWLIGYLMRHSLKVFAVYCIVLGAVTVLVASIRG
jgi:undecaprenyl-diphosphatase